MKDVLDVHTHTLASTHAYSTIRELTRAAHKKGLALLGITEHGPGFPNTFGTLYFQNYQILDRTDYDVPVLFGIELNILDDTGKVDLDDSLLAEMDIAIASLHPPCIAPMTKEQNTKTLLQVMKHPHIHIIGHLDDGRYPLDYDEIARAAKQTHTLLELNNSSLAPTSFRKNAKEYCLEMLAACEKHGAWIVINSDAHVDTLVGNHTYATAVVKEAHFPEELIVNTDVQKLQAFL